MGSISLDDYFMKMAEIAKLRATCLRRAVGAIFVMDGRIVSTGYNGSPSGTPHCNSLVGMNTGTVVGCLMDNNHCIRSIHAEMNGILNASMAGQSLNGATVYTTTYPCIRCLSALRNARIERVVYQDPYPHSEIENKLFRDLEPLFKWTHHESKT